jgi:hypothetical protein
VAALVFRYNFTPGDIVDLSPHIYLAMFTNTASEHP